ncbi:ShlB/FhaC/HecB family hemolysin secretion/activation protein [Acidiphilium sp. C61]|uniref:ShlB/FhaC/HecB family hemolysin secretion/activation protein n=1 Tax=Acidiphilium sp. C61 TaxID=1671485 RepID=UPI00157B264B|nr:ShlB/FhaC/HecB family hemolysin secretion/activation protein [Acidiphilium sp. C61]
MSNLSRAVLCTALGAAVSLPALASVTGAPPAGGILHQLAPAPVLPALPGGAIRLAPASGQHLHSKLRIPVSRIEIEGNHKLPTSLLAALMRPVEGRTVSLDRLQTYVARISAAYHRRGYLLAFAYLPPQSIRHGVVRVAVVEPRYDAVTVSGASRFRASQALRVMGVKAGEAVRLSPLNRGLLLLNRTPGVRVEGALVPGSAPGTTTLRLTRQDGKLLGFSLTQSNAGSRYTGAEITSATARVNDPFGYGGALSLNGAISGTGNLRSGGFEVDTPDLWNGVQAGLYGSATDYRLGGAFTALDEVGRATQFGGYVSDPVLLGPRRVVELRLDVLEAVYAQSTRSTATTARQTIPQERLSVSGQLADRFGGATAASLSLTHGNLSIGPAAARAADAAGPRAAGGFEVLQARLHRAQSLPLGLSLTLDAQAQLASKNLDSSQQLYLGGPYGVMAYPVSAGGGDEGYLLSGGLSHIVPVPHLPGVLTASLLAQAGTVWLHHTAYPGATGKPEQSEAGIGFGLDERWRGINLDLTYAHQIGANSAPTISHARDQLLFQVTFSR